MENNITPKKEPSVANDAQASHLLSREETREILTPFAFEIDKSLFGLPLASPYKRGLALLVDLLAIAILSGAPGELLAIVLAVTFYRLGNQKRAKAMGKVKGKKRRAFARFTGALILFVLLADLLPKILNDENSKSQNSVNSATGIDNGVGISPSELGLESTVVLTKTIIDLTTDMKESRCKDLDCWQEDISPTLTQQPFISLELPLEFVKNALKGIAEETALPQPQQIALEQRLLKQYQLARDKAGIITSVASVNAPSLQKSNNESELDSGTGIQPDTLDVNKLAQNIDLNTEGEQETAMTNKQPIYSFMEYAKGIINDLGLGFGWAAFYFTVFTSIWKGQTLGKKIFQIKVLQLDGTPLSLWDSFGRYGGYGAGIATGLLGFMQIFWDANRQAIHDKISATVVVDAHSTLQK